MPKNIGINESSCQGVGILRKKSQANKRVNSGEMLPNALAFTTLTL